MSLSFSKEGDHDTIINLKLDAHLENHISTSMIPLFIYIIRLRMLIDLSD